MMDVTANSSPCCHHYMASSRLFLFHHSYNTTVCTAYLLLLTIFVHVHISNSLLIALIEQFCKVDGIVKDLNLLPITTRAKPSYQRVTNICLLVHRTTRQPLRFSPTNYVQRTMYKEQTHFAINTKHNEDLAATAQISSQKPP